MSVEDFSRSNCILNNQERFNSIYCFSFPLFLQFEITNHCNLNCIECGVVNKEKSTLPESLFQKLRKIFSYIGGIAWLGGETFLVDYFLELLKTLNSDFPHLRHTIYTNGTLLCDKKITSALADINNLQLKLSLDSIVKEDFEQIRRGAKFETVLNNLMLLNETYAEKGKKPNIGTNVVVMKKNVEQITAYPDFCKKYGLNHFDVSFLVDADPPALPEENIFTNLDQSTLKWLKGIVKEAERKCREFGIRFFCNFNTCLDQVLDLFSGDVELRKIYNQTVMLEQIKERSQYVFKCYYPWTSLYIKCNGLVVPTGDCTIPIGNILTENFQEIWNGEGMRYYRYKLVCSRLSKWCSLHCQQKSKVNKQLLQMEKG